MTDTPLPTSNRAVVWTGARKLEIQQRPILPPGPNEVLVEIIATGICGSDCHNWESDKVSRQLVLGHESSGVILKVGEGVKDRVVGQRVAVEPGFACMECEFCIHGNTNTCANLKYCGLDPTDGTLCQYFTCRASMTVPIPETVSWEEAGAIQPLAIAVQLARRASLNAHQTMAIFGCGPLGLLILAVAKAYGVKKVVMFDIEASRTQFAETYGATAAIVTPKNEDPSKDSLTFAQEYAKDVIDKHEVGHGFDVTVEASGAEICAQMAVCMLKAGGTCIQAGLGKPLTAVPLFLITAKELNLKGTVRYTPGCFADAISLLDRKLVDLKPLITATYPLTEGAKAFEAQHARKDIKIPLIFGTGSAWFKDPNSDATGIDRPTVEGIKAAIEVGYRSLDAAQMYNTETEVGVAIKESGVARDDLFITTKSVGLDDVEKALESSLDKLHIDYVDMYLIHSPFGATSTAHLQAAWRSMEHCVERGLSKRIGVSNFSIQNLQTILEVAKIKPAVDQVEMHPYLYQRELYKYLEANGIGLQGFSSLTPLRHSSPNKCQDVCKRLAMKYQVSEQAILLRWSVEQGAGVVTTSSSMARLATILKEVPSFSLVTEEVSEITESGQGEWVRGFFTKEFEAEEGRTAEKGI